MVVTIFRSRLKSGSQQEYYELAARMGEIARTMPGYISHKGFTNEDGERVTIVEFESEEAQRLWAVHAEHLEAKKKGRKDFYAQYRILVCKVERESTYVAEPARPGVSSPA